MREKKTEIQISVFYSYLGIFREKKRERRRGKGRVRERQEIKRL